MADIFRKQRTALSAKYLTASQQLANGRNNFLVDTSTHAMPGVSNMDDFAASVLPGESATLTGYGLIDNTGGSNIKLIAFHWSSGTAIAYEG